MMIRFGHVANSSSTTFYLVFMSLPKTVEDMLVLLFGTRASKKSAFSLYDYSTTKGAIAEQVFQDASDVQKHIRLTEIDSSAPCEEMINQFSRRYACHCWPVSPRNFPKQDVRQWFGVNDDRLQAWQTYVLETEGTVGFRDPAKKPDYEMEHELSRRAAEEDVRLFLMDHAGATIVKVEYADEDGAFGCIMEHGQIFRRIPHVACSNH